MTNYSKFRALSLLAGVISLYFTINLAAELLMIAYFKWTVWKTVRDFHVVAAHPFPDVNLPHASAVFLTAAIAVAAFWCRSRFRHRMAIEGPASQVLAHERPAQPH